MSFNSAYLGTPNRLGPYQILRKLGEGGMGSVFLAEQLEPVRRRVAIKLARAAFLDEKGRLRFEAERQAMARLQHPNVAQIFEAGTTEEGFPYFAMEHVDGLAVTEFCDSHRLSIKERLQLFRRICSGVEHAHQKGLIHRDLKPSNILVTRIEGRAVPKIIDFGIAKALDHPLTDSDMPTENRLVGTPAYLSPEAAQVGQGSPDLDTRSDVYSLGILLYELLVGQRPFDDAKNNLFLVLNRIAAEEPTEPSTHWARLDEATRHEIALSRDVDPRTFRSSLQGDLDWIVLRAIAKDRNDRYGSAADLSRDIERHLNHLPVEASPPSTIYRLRKFMRRRAGAVTSAVLVLAALCLGLVARTLEARRANREAAAAVIAREETELALARAEQARIETQEISEFLLDLFKVSDPGEAKGNTVTARELLDDGARKVRVSLADQPLARARFMLTMAEVYRKLGLWEPARLMLEESLEIRRRLLEPDHPGLAEALNGLGALEALLGNFEKAEPLFQEALTVREKASPHDHYAVAMSLINLANVYTDLGRGGDAEPLYERSLALVEESKLEPTQDLLVGLNNLASLYLEQRRYKKAEPLLRTFLDEQIKAHGEQHPYVAFAMENLALARRQGQDYGESERLYREALIILERVFPPDHPEIAYCLSEMAALFAEMGQSNEAESHYRRALAIQEVKLPPDHPERVATEQGLRALAAD